MTKRTWIVSALASGVFGCGTGGMAVHDGATDAPIDAIARIDVTTGDLGTGDVGATDVVNASDGAADSSSTDARADGSSSDAAVDAGCHLPIPAVDSLASARDACMFTAGSHVADTIADPQTLAAARAAIQHVIVLTQENHSMDNYFGRTAGIDGFATGYSNTDTGGVVIAAHHLSTPCPCDPDHSRAGTLTGYDMGAMDGFARANPTTYQSNASLGYYTDADHPFYSWLLTTFATSDRYFSAVLDATGPNRRVLYDATNRDVWSANPSPSTFPPRPSIFAALNDGHVTWANYAHGTNTLEGIFGQLTGLVPNVYPYDNFVTLVTADNPDALPSVMYIDAGADEHPTANIHQGEQFMHDLFALVFAHPRVWAHTAILFTYDEGGGFFDHVPPPSACVPTTNAYDAGYDHLGIRVPIYAVSPYARPHYVSHRTHTHTSILRFIEGLFDLPALTKRDANSDALFDMFDFGCPSFATAPAAVPAAATGACTSSCAQ